METISQYVYNFRLKVFQNSHWNLSRQAASTGSRKVVTFLTILKNTYII